MTIGLDLVFALWMGAAAQRDEIVTTVPYREFASAVSLSRWANNAEGRLSLVEPRVQFFPEDGGEPIEDIVLQIEGEETLYPTGAFGVSALPLDMAYVDQGASVTIRQATERPYRMEMTMLLLPDSARSASSQRLDEAQAEYQSFRQSFNFLIRRFVPQHTKFVMALDEPGSCDVGQPSSRGRPDLWDVPLGTTGIVTCTADIEFVFIGIT